MSEPLRRACEAVPWEWRRRVRGSRCPATSRQWGETLLSPPRWAGRPSPPRSTDPTLASACRRTRDTQYTFPVSIWRSIYDSIYAYPTLILTCRGTLNAWYTAPKSLFEEAFTKLFIYIYPTLASVCRGTWNIQLTFLRVSIWKSMHNSLRIYTQHLLQPVEGHGTLSKLFPSIYLKKHLQLFIGT